MRGTNLDVGPLAFSSASLAWRRVMLLTPAIRVLQPLLSLLLSTTFNRHPTTGCSPTNWVLSGHEPDCQSCNISGTFLQIQSDIFFEHERKIKTPCTTWFLKMKQDSLSFCQSNGPILWQSKILPYYLIPLCNILPLKSLAGCCKKSHTDNETTSKIYSIQPFPSKTTLQAVSYKPLNYLYKYRHDNNYILYRILKIMEFKRKFSKQ